MKKVFFGLCILLVFGISWTAEEKNKKDSPSSSTFDSLKFRCIGPALTSGRVGDFSVNPDNPYEYHAAVASGHV